MDDTERTLSNRLLVERDGQLAAIARNFATAREGAGRIVVVEGPAGNGKSSLLAAAGEMAVADGMQVLSGRGQELERDFLFGLALQLFESKLIAAESDDWADLLAGPAGLARGLLERSHSLAGQSPEAREYSLIHGLYWLTRNLISPAATSRNGGPLVILVDDVHWADRSSLRFLSYLAERFGDLPVAVVLAVDPGETTADPATLTALRHAGTPTLVRLASLSAAGVEQLTPSERRVADHAASGLSTRQIAEALYVTPKTVEFHLRHVYQKLDVGSRAQLTAVMPPSGVPTPRRRAADG